jgi:ComF family protein
MPYGTEFLLCEECLELADAGRLESQELPQPLESELFRVFSSFPYSGVYKDAVLRFKYEGRKAMARELGQMMWQVTDSKAFHEAMRECDVFVPVPLHKGRERMRGYNQAMLLALALGKLYGKPVADCLRRVRRTRPMARLTPEGRLKNIKGAFLARNPEPISTKSVMLIDDIYTTGATARECASALKSAGAGRVCAFTFTRA